MDNLLFFVAEPFPEGVRVEKTKKILIQNMSSMIMKFLREKNSTNMNYFILGNGVSQKVPYF